MADAENIVRIQTNFTAGEFDPLLRGRIDLEQYASAAATLTNVICYPQGGLTRRPGTQYIGEIPSAASPASGVRLVNFEFSTEQQYVFLFSNNRLYIYKTGVLQTNINSSGNDYLDLSATGIVSAKLAALYFCQSADTLIICHEDFNPVTITRGASHTTWTVANIVFKYIPKHAFTIATSNPAGTVEPDEIDGNVTLTSSSSVWVSGNVNQYVNAVNGFGRARITKYNSASVVEAYVEIPFSDTDAIANGDWELVSGYEDAWSSSKGWPRSCTFHEGRLFFGGSKNRPSTVWGSFVGDFYNFNPGQQLADEGLAATIDTDQVNAIVSIVSNRDLLVFTTGGEFFVPQGALDPIEPANIIFKNTTRSGSMQIKPIVTENATYYIQRQGKQLREFVFADDDVNYRSNNFSLFSSHMINSPVDVTYRKQTSTNSSDLILVINGDGGISAYPFLRSQQVVSPSSWTTDGTFLNACTDFNEIYVAVKRQLPTQATCTITVTDAANIAVGSTIVITDNAGTSTTMTATNDDPADALEFSVGGSRTNNDVADNIAVGSGGVLGINALSGYAAPNPAANVITVTRAVAGGNNLTVTSSDNTRITCTNFTGGTTDKYYLEKFDNDFTTDAGTQYYDGTLPAGTSVTGLTELENYVVDVVRDDLALTQKTVSSGAITIDQAASSYVEVGLPYTPTITTLPVETRLPTGNVQGFIKRITECNLILYRTQNISVDGEAVTFRNLEDLGLGEGMEYFTGIKKVAPLSGFSDESQLTITQAAPLFFTLLAIEYKVSI